MTDAFPGWSRGNCVLTPDGVAVIHDYDLQRDLVFTNLGAFDACDLELVVLDLPDFNDLEAVDAWLRAGPQPDPVRAAAKRGTVRCDSAWSRGCDCRYCYRMVVVHGGRPVSCHYQDAPACPCLMVGCECVANG